MRFSAPDALARARRVRLMIFDVDGVLTDGRLWYGPAGEELKAFHSFDGHGMKMLASAGIACAVLSGRRSGAVAARCGELGIGHVLQGIDDKLATYQFWSLPAGSSQPAGEWARIALGVAEARHLSLARLPAQLQDDLVHLAQARRADRLAVRDQPSVGVHRQRAADLQRAVRDQAFLVAIGAEAVLRQVDDLGARVRVLELDHVDVLGADARHLERGA